MTGILIAVAVVAGVGIVIGILLGVAGEKFKVEVDEKEIAVRELLPGNNCGGCGYPGCDGLAAAIAKGEMPPSACPVGGEAVAAKISEVMGVENAENTRYVAFVKCAGDCEKAKDVYDLLDQGTVSWHRTIQTAVLRHVHMDVQVMAHVRQYVSSGY